MTGPLRWPADSTGANGTCGPVDDRVLGRWLWDRLRSSWPLLAVAVTIVVAAALTTVRPDETLPLSPDSREQDGTAALVDVLAALDRPARVVGPDAVGNDDVVLVLQDQFDDDARRRVRSRVRAGARVVVADPDSPLVPERRGTTGLLDRTLARACDVPALRDVDAIRPAGGDALYDVEDGAAACFTTDGGAWLVITPQGRGHVVALGGPGVLTNAGMRSAADAVLVTQLLTPQDTDGPAIVRPVPATPTGGDAPGLWDVVPSGVRVMATQLLIAFGVFVMWRARRLGRPLVNDAPVRLGSSDLTTAVGALHARNATRADAVRRIADDTRARLARRLGLPRTADIADVADAVAARTRRDPAAVATVLAPPDPADDTDLLAATGALAELEQAVRTTLSPVPEPMDVH
jgi:hypothetical protein